MGDAPAHVAGGQGQVGGRVHHAAQFVQHQPGDQLLLVGAGVRGEGGVDQFAQQRRHAQGEFPLQVGVGGPAADRVGVPVEQPHFRAGEHIQPVGDAGGNPHRQLRRHQPAAGVGVHLGGAGERQDQLGLVVMVLADGLAALPGPLPGAEQGGRGGLACHR